MPNKALILTWERYQDHEVIYPYYRVQEEGFEVDIMSNVVGRIHGILGTYMECSQSIFDLDDKNKFSKHMSNYNLLIIPGGVKALEYLRQNKSALEFISEWDKNNKIIACICHGAQLLISAKITKGREVSGYYSIQDDITNSGATYVDGPAVVSNNLVTCPHYKWMGQWMKTVFEVYNGKK